MTRSDHIAITAVTKSFGAIEALRDVDFSVAGGECVALVGPNGAGKSTLFKLILGLIAPTSGSLRILGMSPGETGFSSIRRNIGFLPEQVLFQGSLSGRETLQFFTRLKGARTGRVDELFGRVDLRAAADRRVATYSKGMRQRLGLAQALIGEPELLILDEPTSGLDPAARTNFFEIIEEMKAQGAAILMSSHGLTELEARTDRVAILNRGTLIANATIKELKTSLSLSSRIKIRAGKTQLKQLEQHFAGSGNEKFFVNGIAVLECPEENKIALLTDLMSSGIALEGIDIIEPTLEQVFDTYIRGGARP